MLGDLGMARRLARDFTVFLPQPCTAAECHRLLEDQLAPRDESFLHVVKPDRRVA